MNEEEEKPTPPAPAGVTITETQWRELHARVAAQDRLLGIVCCVIFEGDPEGFRHRVQPSIEFLGSSNPEPESNRAESKLHTRVALQSLVDRIAMQLRSPRG